MRVTEVSTVVRYSAEAKGAWRTIEVAATATLTNSNETLVLQFPLSSQAATAMVCLGYLLVPTPPAGPANDLRWRVSRDPQEADQESTDLRDSERDVLWAGQRPLLAAPTARATRVRVIWRYQPCPLRTS